MFKKFCAVFIIFLMVFSLVDFGFSSENIMNSDDGTNTGVESLAADNNLVPVTTQATSYSSHPVYDVISGYQYNFNPNIIHATGCTAVIINARCSGLTDNRINEFKNAGLKVYLYCPSFFNPDTGNWDYSTPDSLNHAKARVSPFIDRVKGNSNIDGIILDYIRTSGTYPDPKYKNLICDLIAFSRDRLGNDKSLSAFIMPEMNGAATYGQDIDLMKSYLNEIILMSYKGNYQQNSDWIRNIMDYFQSKVEGSNCKASAIIQSYRSDSDLTLLPTNELYSDMDQVIKGGGYGTGLFRAGLNTLSTSNPYTPYTELNDVRF
ncbi:MAG: hypothetical protein LBV42_02895 [Methanobrevibacter sp.]|jgi:hypothetical protein|nr:hypothetical protein [Methanobrevibacter sp.]